MPTTLPTRRSFQFGLGAMFIAVLLLAIALGWLKSEWQFVLNRKALIEEFSDRIGPVGYLGPYFNQEQPTIPFWREWMGDEPRHGIDVPYGAPKQDFKRARQLFPEAEIHPVPGPRKPF
jgi:hypothetical protein